MVSEMFSERTALAVGALLHEALVKNIVSEPPENFFQIFLQISL